MQEEEMSVSDILSSIRDVLSKEMQGEIVELASDQIQVNQNLSPINNIEPIRPPVFHKPEFVLELTPQMRVQKDSFLPGDPFLSKKPQVSAGLPSSQNMEANLQPMMQDWLDKNMPAIVEKVVAREVKRLFSGK